jgi:hypothetical protein
LDSRFRALLGRGFSTGNENGMALITGLMLIAALSVLSSAAYFMFSLELMIVRNDLAGKKAFYMAEAGIEEARARLPGWIPEAPHDRWRVFVLGGDAAMGDFSVGDFGAYDPGDPDHHLYSSLQNDMNVLAEIRILTEASDGSDLNNDSDTDDVVFWGDVGGDFVCEENVSTGFPMAWIRGAGLYGEAKKRVEVKIRPSPVFPDPKTRLWSPGGGGAAYPVDEALARALSRARATLAPGHYVSPGYGSAGDPLGLFFCPGDLSLENVSGYGLLAVTGTLTFSGVVSWEWAIIAGQGIVAGPGTSGQISGAAVSGGSAAIPGGLSIIYNAGVVARLRRARLVYETVAWRRFE